MADLSEILWVVREKEEVVATVGVTVDNVTGVADIGPLAVSVNKQGAGLGGRIMTAIEAQYDITEVRVISCKATVLQWYEGRGYTTCQELPIDEVLIEMSILVCYSYLFRPCPILVLSYSRLD